MPVPNLTPDNFARYVFAELSRMPITERVEVLSDDSARASPSRTASSSPWRWCMESPRPSDKTPATEPVILRCACCGLPFARLEGDKLVIESRHKGEVHVNEINVGALGGWGLRQSSE